MPIAPPDHPAPDLNRAPGVSVTRVEPPAPAATETVVVVAPVVVAPVAVPAAPPADAGAAQSVTVPAVHFTRTSVTTVS
jgi:hypothetical protein